MTPSAAGDADAAAGDLAAALAAMWARLAAAVDDRAAPLRTPIVATVRGGRADARVLVLRGVDAARGELLFFSDVRAAKVADVAAAPHVAIVGYDPAARLQLRLRGTATVAAGAAADRAWAHVPHDARTAYRTLLPPGTPAPTSLAAGRLDPADGRDNFALVTVTVDTVEWLDLAGSHRRARYRRDGEAWHGSWLVP